MILAKLKDHMKEKGLRPEDIAAKSGLSIGTVQSARNGKNVNASTANAIAHALKCKVDELEVTAHHQIEGRE